jgi:hypothetical protein
MSEWGLLGWYEMAAFAIVRGRCCPGADPIALPSTSCEPLDAALNDLADSVGPKVQGPAEADAALDRYTAAVHCAMKTRSAASYPYGALKGGEESALRKMLARAVGPSPRNPVLPAKRAIKPKPPVATATPAEPSDEAYP